MILKIDNFTSENRLKIQIKVILNRFLTSSKIKDWLFSKTADVFLISWLRHMMVCDYPQNIHKWLHKLFNIIKVTLRKEIYFFFLALLKNALNFSLWEQVSKWYQGTIL